MTYTGEMLAKMFQRRNNGRHPKPPHIVAQESSSAMPVRSLDGSCFRDTADECKICYTEFQRDESFLLSCGHAWHRRCLQRYVEIGIESALVSNLNCHSCGERISSDNIKELVSHHQFTKYQRFLQNMEIDQNPELRWCPTPGCETVLRREKANKQRLGTVIMCRVTASMAAGVLAAVLVRQLGLLRWEVQVVAAVLAQALVLARTHASAQPSGSCRNVNGLKVHCPSCEQSSCFDCGSAWHAGQSCRQAEEAGLASWAAGRDVRRCPRCRSMIEKNAGCKHMTCSNCRFQFCWLCMRKWSSGHLCLGIGTGTLHCESMVAQLRSKIAGPPWVAGHLFFCASLWLARLLRPGCSIGADMNDSLLTFDSTSQIHCFMVLLVAGCGLGIVKLMGRVEAWILAQFGRHKQTVRVCLFAAVCCGTMVLVLAVRSYLLGAKGLEWIKLLWLANCLVVAHSCVWTQHSCAQHALSFLQRSKRSRIGLAAIVLSPLLLMVLLQAGTCIWAGPDATSFPELYSHDSSNASAILLTQDFRYAGLTPPPDVDTLQDSIQQGKVFTAPNRSEPKRWKSASKLSQALAEARTACSDCEENQALNIAFGAMDQAVADVATDMDDLQLRLQRLESIVAAGAPNQASSFGSWMQWLFRLFKASLVVALIFAALLVHAASCFLTVLTTDDLENRYHAKHGQRAFAASRSLLFCFLILELSAGSSSGYVGFSVWLGARLFIPFFCAFLMWEVGDQLLKLSVLLGLFPAFGVRALVTAGWPFDVVPLAWGGAMSFALVADGTDSVLASCIRSIPFLQPRGVGVICGVFLWALGHTSFMHGLVSIVLAGSAPLAIETAWASLMALS